MHHSPPPVSARTCSDCGRHYTVEEMRASHGWQPTAVGWRCPSCARAYDAMIEWFAHDLVAQHSNHRLLATHLHRRSSCMACDIVWRAREIVLTKPSPAWLAKARARNLETIRRALVLAGDLERRRARQKSR